MIEAPVIVSVVVPSESISSGEAEDTSVPKVTGELVPSAAISSSKDNPDPGTPSVVGLVVPKIK